MSGQSVEEIRAKAQEISTRAKSDPAFVREFQHDPVAALEGAGLPQAAIGDFLREEGIQEEVSGYLAASGCTSTSCTCTGCCITKIVL